MAYRDPETGKLAKAPDYSDEVTPAQIEALRQAAPQDEAKMGTLVHGLEWDMQEESELDLLGGPTARQLWLFAIAAVIVIVAVAALVQPS